MRLKELYPFVQNHLRFCQKKFLFSQNIFSFIEEIAAAASWSGTATLTISHPAFSKRFICETVAGTSWVDVFVMDCTVTGAVPPTFTFPTLIWCVFFRLIKKDMMDTTRVWSFFIHGNYKGNRLLL